MQTVIHELNPILNFTVYHPISNIKIYYIQFVLRLNVVFTIIFSIVVELYKIRSFRNFENNKMEIINSRLNRQNSFNYFKYLFRFPLFPIPYRPSNIYTV